MNQFAVAPGTPQLWAGRYARIPGETTAIHVRLVDGVWWPVVEWAFDGMTAECPMIESAGAAALASIVNAGKAFLSGGPGGSFLINEYGQILVPASSPYDTRVAIVGECTGPIEFMNSAAGSGTFDLANDTALGAGDNWDRPYVGIPHQLSRRSELYFWEEGDGGGEKLLPRVQDSELITSLRQLRGHGPVRLLAAYGGFVLTKVLVGRWPHERWEPRYVGRIDFRQWFAKEG